MRKSITAVNFSFQLHHTLFILISLKLPPVIVLVVHFALYVTANCICEIQSGATSILSTN